MNTANNEKKIIIWRIYLRNARALKCCIKTDYISESTKTFKCPTCHREWEYNKFDDKIACIK